MLKNLCISIILSNFVQDLLTISACQIYRNIQYEGNKDYNSIIRMFPFYVDVHICPSLIT